MIMGTRQFVIAAVLPLAILTACIDNADLDGPSASASPAMLEDGRAIAEANCASCHAIGKTGQSPNPKAPTFRTVLKRYNAEMLGSELAEGMRVAHTPMPQFQFRPEAVDSLIAYMRSVEIQGEGQALVEQRCAKCHAIGTTDTSPYPGAQPFRNLGQRWRRGQLRQALLAGIMAEHDRSDIRLPPMMLSEQEADALLDYLDAISSATSPAPR